MNQEVAMHVPANRSIVVISSLLTLLILGGTTRAVGFHKGWLPNASRAAASDALTVRTPTTERGGITPAPVTEVSTVPAANGAADDVAAYQQKLDEAYRALEDAYAQIRVLQAPQSQVASLSDRGTRYADDDRHDGRRQRRVHEDD